MLEGRPDWPVLFPKSPVGKLAKGEVGLKISHAIQYNRKEPQPPRNIYIDIYRNSSSSVPVEMLIE